MVGPRSAEFAEESAEVEVLFAQTKKHEDIGRKIKASLSRIQESENSLQTVAGGPLYSDTQRLQVTERNVASILAAIEKLQRPLEGKADEERIIYDGPSRAGLPAYLDSIHRVEAKFSALKASNVRINQEAAGELARLLEHGSKQLQGLFETAISADVRKIEPLAYLTKQTPFPTIPQERLSELASLDRSISANQPRGVQNVSPTVRIYAEIRGSYLSASLQNLASASISTSKKKTPDEVYRGGTSGIGIYSGALNAMFGAEWQNVTQIFSRENCATVFEMTTRKALAEFARTLRELNSQIKANITTDCFLAYEILEIVSRLSSRLDDQTGQLKPQLTDAVKPIRETAKVSLSDLLDDVRRRIGSMTFFPVDAAALPYTTEVMTRVQTLITYPDALSSIMTSLGDGNWASAASGMNESSTSLSTTKSFDVGADGEKIRAHYVQDTMEIFLTSLDAKSKPMMKSRTVHGVFLANNIVVMDRMMRQSDIHKLLVTTKSQNKLDIWKKRAQASYLDCWREPCATLMDVQYTNRGARPPSGSSGSVDSAAIVKGLSSKDRDSVKEKFKHFNILFESCSAKHRELVGGMEREVRSQVAREIQTMIEPLYARYWDRYHEVDKGKGKYVKYDKPALSAALTSLG